jgi:hypothetical protein
VASLEALKIVTVSSPRWKSLMLLMNWRGLRHVTCYVTRNDRERYRGSESVRQAGEGFQLMCQAAGTMVFCKLSGRSICSKAGLLQDCCREKKCYNNTCHDSLTWVV